MFCLLGSFASLASAIDMKVDRITINAPAGGSSVAWATVTFQQSFGSVPVVIVTPTNSNTQPATVRIRNVTTTGFEVGLVEPPGADGQTADMTVDYFAAETGVYTFPGAVRMVVGAYTTSTYQGRYNAGQGWDDVNFPTTFGSAPAVVAQVQTINSQPTLDAGDLGVPFFDVTIRNVRTVDMDVALERAETNTGTVVAETIGYIAMESGDEVTVSGMDIKALLTPDNVSGWSNGCYVRNYSSSFGGTTPLVVASQNSRDGSDGGWVRICSVSDTGVGLQVDEDQARDSDRSHTTEEIGVFAIEGAFHGTRNGRDIEADSVTIPGTAAPTDWTTVTFPNPFNNVPLIFALPTTEGTSPAAIRTRNVTNTGFDIAAFQPTGGTGAHPEMEIDYVAIIEGEHTLPNGDVFEAGFRIRDEYVAGTGGSTGTFDINFNSSFSGGAAMLLGIQGNNNEPALDPNNVSEPWMVTATTVLNSSLARVAIDRAEAINGSISANEIIAYFAVEDGLNNTLDATDGGSVDYEMFLTPDNILGFDNGCYNNNYTDTYASPYAIATQSSRDGGNGGWVRRCNLESTRIGLTIDEDQARDSERAHTTEEASVFVFSRAFEAEFNTIDHYAIFHSGAGVTCEAESITIAAHDASELGVEAGGRTITVTATSSTPGWLATDVTWTLASGTGTFSTPAAGQAEYTFDTGESSVQLQLANTSEADIDIDVTDGLITDQDGVAEDPLLSFAATGLRFYNDADGDDNADGTDPIQNPLTSGRVSNQLILRGIETNSTNGACDSRVSLQTLTVNMGYECVNPIFCHDNADMEINGTPIEENDTGNIVDFAPVSLDFDADGEAIFTMEYFDVGVVTLHANVFVAADGTNPAVTLVGSSDSTVVRPADIIVTRVERPDAVSNLDVDSFVPSNTPFTVIVQARNEDGGTTPNFGAEIAQEGIVLSVETLALPSTGDLPALTSANTFTKNVTPGEFQNTLVRWPEAGSITINAQIGDGDYLGTGNVVGSTSEVIGRFYPDHLRITAQSLVNGCTSGGFTYMSGQDFNYTPADINFTVEAVTAGLTRLQNYDDTYPTATLVYDAENANDGNNIISRRAVVAPEEAPGGTWVNGEYVINGTDNFGIHRALSGINEVPDGPYSALEISVRTDGTQVDPTDFQSAALTANADTSDDCVALGTCTAIALGNLDVRFGRLFTGDAHGPETAPLSVPFEIQEWDPIEGFVRNVADNCTVIPTAIVSFDGTPLAAEANRTVTVGGGTSEGEFFSFSAGIGLAFTGGDARLVFGAPGAGNDGAFNVDVNLTNDAWLRSDWNNNGDTGDDLIVPPAEISFGRYRGHDRIIYWQEVLN